MNKPIIAVDVDDVLASVNQAMMQFVNEHFGTTHTWEDYTVAGPYRRYWEEVVWKVGPEEGRKRYDAFIERGGQRGAPMLDGAIDVLETLKQTHDLIVITARDHDYIEDTHHWLSKNCPGTFDDIHFLPYHEGSDKKVAKGVIAKQIGASYLIDDNVEHCLGAQENGVTALLFGDYGWNQAAPNSLTRVKDWQAVKEYFDGRS
ncbi:MAG: hypothetical protein ABIQ89_00315 [Candidatus Saccharimonadales bacterium]